jgi:hypothetical protein
MAVYTISTSYKTAGSVSTDLIKNPTSICTDPLADLNTGRNENVRCEIIQVPIRVDRLL